MWHAARSPGIDAAQPAVDARDLGAVIGYRVLAGGVRVQ